MKFADQEKLNEVLNVYKGMDFPFKTSEFVIGNILDIPVAIVDKIWRYHILPMATPRAILGIPMWASEKSGYRPESWEKQHMRSGKSEHVFRGKGAIDWTCKDFAKNKDAFLAAIIKYTKYTRIAIYDSFIHCDYKAQDGKRYIYSSTPSSEWDIIRVIN